MRAHAHELVYGGGSADDGPVTYANVTGKLHAIGDDRMVADRAIVCSLPVTFA